MFNYIIRSQSHRSGASTDPVTQARTPDSSDDPHRRNPVAVPPFLSPPHLISSRYESSASFLEFNDSAQRRCGGACCTTLALSAHVLGDPFTASPVPARRTHLNQSSRHLDTSGHLRLYQRALVRSTSTFMPSRWGSAQICSQPTVPQRLLPSSTPITSS